MNNTTLSKIIYSLQTLVSYLRGLTFSNVIALHQSSEFTSFYKFHNYISVCICLENILELDDMWVANAFYHLDFLLKKTSLEFI